MVNESLGDVMAEIVTDASFKAARYRLANDAEYKFYDAAGELKGYRRQINSEYICINCGPDCQCDPIRPDYELAIYEVIGLLVDKNLFELANEIENKFIKKEEA